MKNKISLKLPESLSNVPMGIAISTLIGYCILNFEAVTRTGAFYTDTNGNNFTLESFFSDIRFNNHVPLLLIYLIQFSLYSFTAVILVKKIIDLKVNLKSALTGISIIGILAFIFIKFTVTTNSTEQEASYQIQINNFQDKITLLVLLGVFVSGCIGILMYLQLRVLDDGIKSLEPFLKDKTHYFKVRKDINWLIFLFGVIISLATLGTGAIQKIAGDSVLAKDAVYYYGILGSVLMCIIYLPLHFKHKTLGYFLIDEYAHEKGITKDSLESIEFYKKMENDLNVNISFKDSIMEAVPILAPSAAALLNTF